MKFFLFLLLFANLAFAEKDKDKKIYSQHEFDEKLKEALKKEVDTIKSKSVADLTKELIEKDHQIKLKTESLIQKDEQIVLAGKDLERRTAEFELEQKKILGCIDKNAENENQRVTQMVSVVSSMKPEK